MLYLIATPIGNLADITLRALEILKTCSLVLCEDTRVSKTLLEHYHIEKPLESFHQFSEAAKEEKILKRLQAGEIICLISDAGTPTISDPGFRLVRCCREKQIPVSSIPGPCAAVVALSGSGLETERFQFIGFLPKKKGELKKTLTETLHYSGTTICYESPERLLNTLNTLQMLAPLRELVVAREITKRFEEWQRGTAEELISYYSSHPLKGEIVLLIGQDKDETAWQELTPEEHIKWLEATYGISQKEAIQLAAKMRGVPKREIYAQVKIANAHKKGT